MFICTPESSIVEQTVDNYLAQVGSHLQFHIQVKEINELRFVLCPKRMNDAQFWSVYFLLSKKYLPLEAFDPDVQLDSLAQNRDTQQVLFDFQTGFKRTIDSARETAKTIATKATNALQPVGELLACISSLSGTENVAFQPSLCLHW